MSNISSIFSLLNGNPMLQQFEQFRKTFTGDPRQKIQEMLNSGQITQAELNRLAEQANQLRKMLR